MTTTNLRSNRWGAWGVLVLGLAVSVAANVLQAQPSVAGRLIAAWPPLALLLALELMTRVLVGRGALTAALWVVTGALGVIAAWVSYWHMRASVLQYGEHGVSAWLLPLTVDGLVVVASGCLVVLTRELRAAEHAIEHEHRPEHAAVSEHVLHRPDPGSALAPAAAPSPLAPAARSARTDDELLVELERLRAHGPLPVRRVVDELKVGTGRARRLIEKLEQRSVPLEA